MDFSIQLNDIIHFTPLANLFPDNIPSLSGLHPVQAKKNAHTFAYTSLAGKKYPLMISADMGRGKILAITTNSLWRLGFQGQLQVQNILRALLHHTMKIYDNPVIIKDGKFIFQKPVLSFNKTDKNKSDQDISTIKALIRRKSFDKSSGKFMTNKADTSFELYPGQNKKINKMPQGIYRVSLRKKGQQKNFLEYDLVHSAEKKQREFMIQHQGERNLAQWAKKNNGMFLKTQRQNIKDEIANLRFQSYNGKIASGQKWQPLYQNKKILLIFLFTGLFVFYIKSRFAVL